MKAKPPLSRARWGLASAAVLFNATSAFADPLKSPIDDACYSLTFSGDGAFIGALDRVMFSGIGMNTTSPLAPTIPECCSRPIR